MAYASLFDGQGQGVGKTISQLAKRLRLRTPTVLHHLQILRLAGLIQVNLGEGKDKTYAARPDAVAVTFDSLRDFLEKTNPW